MRNFIIIFFLLFMCAVSFAQNQLSEKLAVSQVFIKQEAAWNRGNIDLFMDAYWKSDSLQFVGRNGILKGWGKTLDTYKKSYPDCVGMGKLSFDILNIDVLSNQSAFVVGRWLISKDIGRNGLGGFFTVVLKKINGSWVIVSDHSS